MNVDKIKTVLTPAADPNLKLVGLGLLVGKLLDQVDGRIVDLEARQLQKGDQGEKGDPPSQEQVAKEVERLFALEMKAELDDLMVIMAKNGKMGSFQGEPKWNGKFRKTRAIV